MFPCKQGSIMFKWSTGIFKKYFLEPKKQQQNSKKIHQKKINICAQQSLFTEPLHFIHQIFSLYFVFNIQKLLTSMKPQKIIPQKAYQIKVARVVNSFKDQDSILYALGIGFSRNPLKKQDYKYTSEFDPNFTTFPTYYAVLSTLNFLSPLTQSDAIPTFSPFAILHAQQRIQLYKPLKPDTQYTHDSKLLDVADKGKIGLVVFQTNSKINEGTQKQEIVAKSQTSIVIKGLGGFGFKGKNAASQIPPKPTRNPDVVFEDSSFPGQAFLYRLSGDPNPLHIDPDLAAMQNYQKPIIHGLATYGIVARVLVEKLLGGDSNRLKVFHTRFVGHVFPGESYKIQAWKENGYIWFNATVKERGTSCLYGYLVYHPESKL